MRQVSRMHWATIRAGFNEQRRVAIGIGNHQVNIQRKTVALRREATGGPMADWGTK